MRQHVGWILILALSIFRAQAFGQPRVLDAFDSADSWKIITADGVKLSIHQDQGVSGKCLRLDYDFVTGAGYCIIQKPFALPLPANYEFTFELKGEGPANNLEFKLLDTTGDNVWWHIRRALDWPRHWTRMVDKKRRIEFAWGPSGGKPLDQAAKIEFAISSSNGGKGSVWLDELTFRELPPESHEPLRPTAAASSQADNSASPSKALDGDEATQWRSAPASQPEPITFTLDVGRVAEFGGLEIDWDAASRPATMSLDVSDDNATWTPLIVPRPIRAASTILPTPDAESRYIRLTMTPTAPGEGVGIREVRVKDPEFSESDNAFIAALAAEAPRGRYPRPFLNQQSYWTVIGADGDDCEALINEEGAIELCKRGPTLEPFIKSGDKLLTWADATHTQSLERGYLPIPRVAGRYERDHLQLTTTAFADGPPGSSLLWVSYRLKNLDDADGSQPERGSLVIALRPFQVNPPWQRLNNEGGIAKLTDVAPSTSGPNAELSFNDRAAAAITPAQCAAATFECGDIAEWLSSGRPLLTEKIDDPAGRASGAFTFDYTLAPGQEQEFALLVPMHPGAPSDLSPLLSLDTLHTHHDACAAAWNDRVSRATLTVPKQDQWLADAFKSQLAYILINRDGPAIQPGSRSYERSWARDGSMTSAALLTCGHPEEVRAWIDWFGDHQFESGKIPCVVDSRGPDPVPEHDSSGEYIWAVANYYRVARDKSFLAAQWPRVKRAVAYIQSLRAQRMADEYAQPGPAHAFYGLVPESISHEGYSAKPMHSYWDDFFTLLGLKEAAFMANELGDPSADDLTTLAGDFRKCLYDSMRAAMQAKGIDYIPGCVELGDFDSTSTTIALFPCDEQDLAPTPQLRNTFDRYWQFFQARRSPMSAWDAYTPYEIRHVGAFVRLGQPQRAHNLLEWFHQYQRPQAWNHWAEVVWNDPLTPKFIGDMPHTWVGSDFLNSVISIFEYEHDGQLITFAGVPREWLESGEEIAFHDLVTPRGRLSGSMQLDGRTIHVKLWSDGPFATGDITIRKPQSAVGQDAVVRTLPAQVSFEYSP